MILITICGGHCIILVSVIQKYATSNSWAASNAHINWIRVLKPDEDATTKKRTRISSKLINCTMIVACHWQICVENYRTLIWCEHQFHWCACLLLFLWACVQWWLIRSRFFFRWRLARAHFVYMWKVRVRTMIHIWMRSIGFCGEIECARGFIVFDDDDACLNVHATIGDKLSTDLWVRV